MERNARLADGSYPTTVSPGAKDRRHRANGVRVREVEHRLEGVAGAEPLYRLATTLLDPAGAPAAELAALPRAVGGRGRAGRAEGAPARGARRAAQQDPGAGRQGFRGLLPAHFAVRGLTHGAALRAGEDPDRLSSLHAVRVVRRQLPRFAALPPRARRGLREAALAETLEERVPCGVEREMGNYRLRLRAPQPTVRIDFAAAIRIVK